MTQYTLDWSLCKPGAKIVMSNGDRLGVVNYEGRLPSGGNYRHRVQTRYTSGYYEEDGSLWGGGNTIIEIIPPPEPVKVETFVCVDKKDGWLTIEVKHEADYKISFNLIDGKPDCTSITMEAFK